VFIVDLKLKEGFLIERPFVLIVNMENLCEHGRYLSGKWCCLVCFADKNRDQLKKSAEKIEFESEMADMDLRRLTQR